MNTEPIIPNDLDFSKVWYHLQETSRIMRENSLETDRKFQETDRKFQETDQQFKETDKKIKELSGLFTSQWGKLVEALVRPACLSLFQRRGIAIERSMENVKAKHNGDTMEIDVLLVNDSELVIVEVKTTCRNKNITELKEDLIRFKTFFPEFSHYKVYGAIAALKYDAESDKYAYRNGLFVIKTTGEGVVEIDNDQEFVPVAY